uniref:Calreticulin n=1 Tax=Heterosigma akashiwo TaxID=2829 RepID=A0A6V1P0W5_HETAK|mmetsp:Transcript_9287/g.15945  ORF Transcript_9287/g.15945 Transcript_9287/m.15945 type:complete len:392 (-) Transcript_9287:28-1203(-)
MAGLNILLATLFACLTVAAGKIYFTEQFEDGWEDRWVVSSNWKPKAEMGNWVHTAGEWYGDENDKGIQTGEDARFYGLSAAMPEAFDNDGKDIVVQFTVKHEQKIDCGGAYIKILGPDVDQESFGGDTPYSIMFGPDICGNTKKTHAIFSYNDENLLIKDQVKCESDQLSHLYTLHVKQDNTFEIFIDDASVKSGDLEDNWDFLEPKEIKDPDVSKPEDWVDNKMMDDPEDAKPEGYDDIPAEIPDPDAEEPDDWDEEEDGEWEPPMIDNPEYKGEWKPKRIKNPDYKGPWEHPMIPNPDYVEDDKLHHRCKGCTHVGFELWQVKAGTIFDDLLVTDSLEEARAFAKKTFWAKKDAEKAMFEEAEEARRAKDREEMEEEEEEEDFDEHDEL